MARPARVRIRSRKPCVFARLRLFGWNVRFTGTTPSGRSRWKAGKDPVRRWHRSTDGTGLRKQASTRPARQRRLVTPPAYKGFGDVAAGWERSVPSARRPRWRPTTSFQDPPAGSSLAWGQRWGRAVDERGTTGDDDDDPSGLGTGGAAVPRRILTVICALSREDGRSSTCPQDLRLFLDFSVLTSIQTNGLGTEEPVGASYQESGAWERHGLSPKARDEPGEGALLRPQVGPTYPHYEEGT